MIGEDISEHFYSPCDTTTVKFNELPTEILLKIASILGIKSQVCGNVDSKVEDWLSSFNLVLRSASAL